MTMTSPREFAMLATVALRLAYGPRAALGDREAGIVVDILDGRAHDLDYFGNDFARLIWIATVVLRARGAGPSLILVPSSDEQTFLDTNRAPLERVGLQLGDDVLVDDVMVRGVLDIGAHATDDGPRRHRTGHLPDPRRDSLGLVVLLGHSPDGLPGLYHPGLDEWLGQLPREVPVLRCWEDEAYPPLGDVATADSRGCASASQVANPAPRASAESQPHPYLTDLVKPARRVRRPEVSREIAAKLVRPNPPIVAITGRPGCGRTAILREVATELNAAGHHLYLRDLRAGAPDPADDLRQAVELVENRGTWRTDVIVIDDLDVVARLGTHDPALDMLSLITTTHRLQGARFLLVLDDRRLERLRSLNAELADSLHRIPLAEPPKERLVEIVADAATGMAARAGLRIEAGVVPAAIAPAEPTDASAHPGLAINRIGAAIARASLQHEREIRVEHVLLEPRHVAPATAEELETRLSDRVRGQDAAIATVAARLAPPLAGLKLRPERPYGVFLFAGPTGVGKTELAKQVARAVYGTEDALIRLDMSEYANDQDARVKLIGSAKVWKNSTTEGLLTTKVIAQPRSVVLLDEFEKSHAAIWPLFLQVFDEGRLTDGWGNTASFAETIVIMTSNLGVREGNARAAGFGAGEGFRTERQLDAIGRTLPPELLNRITETVCFDTLGADAIRELAELELARLTHRFAATGWHIEYEAGVAGWLATPSCDLAFGARHLQRNIERELLPLLAGSTSRHVRVVADGGKLAIDHT